jgi:hypothetical protein
MSNVLVYILLLSDVYLPFCPSGQQTFLIIFSEHWFYQSVSTGLENPGKSLNWKKKYSRTGKSLEISRSS